MSATLDVSAEQLLRQAQQARIDAAVAKVKAHAEAKAMKAQEKAQKKAAKAAEKNRLKEEKKAAREAERLAKREAAGVITQNGVGKPTNGKSAEAWALMDMLSAQLGQPVAISDLLIVAASQGMNEHTIRSTYANWRKFHNVSGRVQSVTKKAAQQAAEEAKALYLRSKSAESATAAA